jgi:3-mercaptopyruvate sulfurtransferase SseA
VCRVWWTLKYFGYPNVKILNGGLIKWKSEGRDVESGEYPLYDETPDDAQFYNFDNVNENMRVFIE